MVGDYNDFFDMQSAHEAPTYWAFLPFQFVFSWSSNTLATWCEELTHLKSPWCWGRLKAGGEGDDRGWDGWMASLTRWTWVWGSSRSWWWTEKPGVLQSVGSPTVRHEWATELNWICFKCQITVEWLMLSSSATFCVVVRGSALTALKLAVINFQWLATALYLQGYHLLWKVLEPLLHCTLVSNSWAKCAADAVSCLCCSTTHLELE